MIICDECTMRSMWPERVICGLILEVRLRLVYERFLAFSWLKMREDTIWGSEDDEHDLMVTYWYSSLKISFYYIYPFNIYVSLLYITGISRKAMGNWVQTSRSEFWYFLAFLLTLWPWLCYFISLDLISFFYKMDIIIPTSQNCSRG